ncbi:spermatogenesis-associated protein 31D3-like [Microcebus murinus]|uniref:spermatogenesis-associated protein 31D3-like n=1 Tax=Microcebus murinus TaxID=30608 RepID=UPI003F6C6DA2
MMESTLDFINDSEPHGSSLGETIPILTFLRTLIFLFICICYVFIKPVKPTRNYIIFIKHQGRAKRRRNGATLRAQRMTPIEAAERQRLLSSTERPLQHSHMNIIFHLHHPAHPHPLCELCHKTARKAPPSLLRESLHAAAPSAAPFASSTTSSSASPPGLLPPAPPPHPSAPQPLAVPHPSGHTPRARPLLKPEATVSWENILFFGLRLSRDIDPFRLSSPATHLIHARARHHAPPAPSAPPPPDGTLAVTPPKPVPALQNLGLDIFSPVRAREPTPLFPLKRGTDPANLTVSAFLWWQPHAQDLFPSKWAPCDFKKQLLALHCSEASYAGDPAASLGVSASLSLPNSALLAVWERLVSKRGNFLMWKGVEQYVGSILNHLRPGEHLTASGTTLAAAATLQGAPGSFPRCSSEGKAAELHLCPQPLHPDTSEDEQQQKHLELLWQLLSLCGKSLHSVVLVQDSCLPTLVFITTSSRTFKAEGFLAIDHLHLLCLPHTLPQSQSLTLTQVRPLAPFLSPPRLPPPGPLGQIRIRGVSFLQKKTGVHCQPRLITPGYGSCNTCRTHGCRSLVTLHRETRAMSMSMCHRPLSWVSFIRGHGRKDLQYLLFSPPSFQETSSKIPLKKDASKNQELSKKNGAKVHLSTKNSKHGISKSTGRSLKEFLGEKVRTTKSAPSLHHPLPASSPAGKGAQGDLRPCPSGANCELPEKVWRAEDGRQTGLQPPQGSTDDMLQESPGSTTSPATPTEGQPPDQPHLRKRMLRLWQWLLSSHLEHVLRRDRLELVHHFLTASFGFQKVTSPLELVWRNGYHVAPHSFPA